VLPCDGHKGKGSEMASKAASTGTRVASFRPGDVFNAPVQVWHDSWRNADRVLRYVGNCVVCGMPTWAADDGDNDPHGVLGDHASRALHAVDFIGSTGPDVALCAVCGTDEPSRSHAVTVAHAEFWTSPVE
jgi:hypothetical protein